MCWFIPALTGLISWLLARSLYKKSCQYDCQLKVDKLNAENKRLKEELNAAQLKIKAASTATPEAKVYNSAAFDEGMQRLVKIQEDAKATTIENIDVAPAQSVELGKLKADMKTQNEAAKTAKKVAATTGLAAATFAATNVKSDFLSNVVGKDAAKMKTEAVKISKKEAELTKARDEKAKLAKDALVVKGESKVSSGAETTSELSQQEASKASANETKPSSTESSGSSRSRFLTADSFDKKVARAALGKTVKFDDLTLVEGIGPKIAGLFKDAGIATWRKLSETSVSRCQKILDEAGPRYRVHKPDTWPEQAKLAAKGDWETLAKLQDELDGGRKA